MALEEEKQSLAQQLVGRIRTAMSPFDDMQHVADGLEALYSDKVDAEWREQAMAIIYEKRPLLWAMPPERMAAILEMFAEWRAMRVDHHRSPEMLAVEAFLWGFAVGYDWHADYGDIPYERGVRWREEQGVDPLEGLDAEDLIEHANKTLETHFTKGQQYRQRQQEVGRKRRDSD